MPAHAPYIAEYANTEKAQDRIDAYKSRQSGTQIAILSTNTLEIAGLRGIESEEVDLLYPNVAVASQPVIAMQGRLVLAPREC
jgi:hypothetical protein